MHQVWDMEFSWRTGGLSLTLKMFSTRILQIKAQKARQTSLHLVYEESLRGADLQIWDRSLRYSACICWSASMDLSGMRPVYNSWGWMIPLSTDCRESLGRDLETGFPKPELALVNRVLPCVTEQDQGLYLVHGCSEFCFIQQLFKI